MRVFIGIGWDDFYENRKVGNQKFTLIKEPVLTIFEKAIKAIL